MWDGECLGAARSGRSEGDRGLGPRHHHRPAPRWSARAPRALGRGPGRAAAPPNTARRRGRSSSLPRPGSAAPRIRLLAGTQPPRAGRRRGAQGPGPRARRGRGWLPGTPRWEPPRGWGARDPDGEGARGRSAGSAEGPGPGPPRRASAPRLPAAARPLRASVRLAAGRCAGGTRSSGRSRRTSPARHRRLAPPLPAPRGRGAQSSRRRPSSRRAETPTPTARTRAGEGGAPSRPAAPAPSASPGAGPQVSSPRPGAAPWILWGSHLPAQHWGAQASPPPQALLESPPHPSLSFLPGWGAGRAPRAARGMVDTQSTSLNFRFPMWLLALRSQIEPVTLPSGAQTGPRWSGTPVLELSPSPHPPTLAHGGGGVPAGPK